MVPTSRNSFSWRGTSTTRSSSPTSTVSVIPMLGNTTVSSRGMSRSRGFGSEGLMMGFSEGDGICDRSI